MGERKKGFSPLSILAFSIGASMGWGSFLVPCSTYLLKSGLMGTVFGLVSGLAFILVIAWNLQYMICNSPSAGGIYSFSRESPAGRDLGFLAFWFILLTYLSLLWANVTSLPLFAEFFLKDTFKFGFSYTIFGCEVWLGEALVCILILGVVGLVCSKSASNASRIMIVLSAVIVAGFVLCALVAAFKHDSSDSYSPLFLEGSNAVAQVVRIAVISPWAFIGFESVAHFSEEYSFPLGKIRRILIASVIITAVLYLSVTVLSVSAYPAEYGSWIEYIKDMGNLKGLKAVPAFYAAYRYLGRTGVFILMLSLFAVILTSLIGDIMALSRLISTAGKEGDVPRKLSSPNRAILAVVLCSALITFIGRTAVDWIVDISTICATIVFFMLSYTTFRKAQQLGNRTETVTGIIGMIIMGAFSLVILVPGLIPDLSVAKETYMLFILWILLGLLYYRVFLFKKKRPEDSQQVIVWIIPLVLVLFSSLMLASRLTVTAAEKAADVIYEYHQSNPELLKKQFIQEQGQQISNTTTLFSIISIGLFLLFSGVIFSSYRDFKKLGRKLSEAEKVASVKESVSAMMNNMPAMSFTKDAETGKYLACNQSFAEYAFNGKPEDVVGLTDYDLVSRENADRYREEDLQVMTMDKPLVRFGQQSDSSGRLRSIQSTKLKFHDANGRLCILGMLVDVTEVERLRSSNAVYEGIVKVLTDNYFNVFYVNLETDDYIEYGVRTEVGHSLTESRGEGFFRTMLSNARVLIYPEDLDRVIGELNKEHILNAVDEKGFFEIEYRLVIGGVPTHVCLKAKRVENDDKHLIVGISNINSLVKGREAIRQAEEERKTYIRLSALNGNLMVLYYVDPETEDYTEFSTSERFEELGLAKRGDQFFRRSYENGAGSIHPEDLELIKTQFTKENVLRNIERDNVFVMDYRLKLQDRYSYMRLKAACVEESGKKLLIIGAFDVDAQVRQEQEIEQNLSEARTMANKDSLTGVRNKRAYQNEEKALNEKIASGEISEFALVVFDINDLKIVNDTQGHKAGDELIKKASSIICNIFKHSPVFRIGGDEFAVICQGDDYQFIGELMAKMDTSNHKTPKIAYGMARYEGKGCVCDVFERADQNMYKNKVMLKENR